MLLLKLRISCFVSQEVKSKLRTWTTGIGGKIEAPHLSLAGDEAPLPTKGERAPKAQLKKLSNAAQEFIKAKVWHFDASSIHSILGVAFSILWASSWVIQSSDGAVAPAS